MDKKYNKYSKSYNLNTRWQGYVIDYKGFSRKNRRKEGKHRKDFIWE